VTYQVSYLERLRGLREDKDLTQTEIACFLGVAQTTYSQYETGRRALPIEYFIELCKFYGVSADYVLGLKRKG